MSDHFGTLCIKGLILAVKLVLRFVTSEFNGDDGLKVIFIGSSRFRNRIF